MQQLIVYFDSCSSTYEDPHVILWLVRLSQENRDKVLNRQLQEIGVSIAQKPSKTGWSQTLPTQSEADPIKISLQDCLACSGCVTSAETVLLEHQSIGVPPLQIAAYFEVCFFTNQIRAQQLRMLLKMTTLFASYVVIRECCIMCQ